jgi:hypothetical protein
MKNCRTTLLEHSKRPADRQRQPQTISSDGKGPVISFDNPISGIFKTVDALVLETRRVSFEVVHFLATKWRQHIAAGVSPQIPFETHREPRSGGSKQHADIAVAASPLRRFAACVP